MFDLISGLFVLVLANSLKNFFLSCCLCLSAKVPRNQTDCSVATVQAICAPFEGNVLCDLDLLKTALKSQLLRHIPVDRYIEDGSGLAVTAVFEKSDNGDEACFLVDRYRAFEGRRTGLRVGMSEESVFACITEVTGMMWGTMALHVQLAPIFSVRYNKKDESGATEADGRPDETDFLNDFMVCKSEHKHTDLSKAISELTSKLTGYNHIEYGLRIVYLPAIAAASTFVEVAVIDVRTKVYHQVARYDLESVGGRVQCFVTMINIFRLIHTMAPHIPTNPTPLFRTLDNNIEFRESHNTQYVRKKIPASCTCPDALYELLGRQAVPCAVRVERVRGSEYLKVTPVGVRTPDRGQGLQLREVKEAVRCVLKCLVYLHEHGFTHRDLRWANLIRLLTYRHDGSTENCTFLVIDFEFAARNGDKMKITGYKFSDVVAYGNVYNSRHDLELVGKLVESWASSNNQVLDETALSFIAGVKRQENPLDASTALNHEWFNTEV